MKPNKYDLQYKSYLKKEREYNKLWQEIRKAPYKTVPAFQYGWLISYDLRDDIKNRKDYPEILEAVRLTFKNWVTRDVKLVRMIRQLKLWTEIRNNKLYPTHLYSWYPRGLSYSISEEKYKELPPSVAKLFYIAKYDDYFKLITGKPRYKINIPYYWIALKAKPNMVNQVKDIDSALQSKHDRLGQELRPLWLKYSRNYGKSFPKSKYRTELRDKIGKFMKNEIEDIHIDVIMDYEY